MDAAGSPKKIRAKTVDNMRLVIGIGAQIFRFGLLVAFTLIGATDGTMENV